MPQTIRLRQDDRSPKWYVHPQHGHRVDIVALPIVVEPPAAPNPFNDLEAAALRLEIGMDVFILGYPFQPGPTALPIWKRASVASEPQAIVPEQLHILLDTASRPGMSGSPVIRRSWAAHLYENQEGSVLGRPVQTRLVGVYSGRVGASDVAAQLGIMWAASFVTEIVAGRVLDAP